MHWERWFDIARLQLRSLFRRRATERELERELEFHLDQEMGKHAARGLTPSEARSAAVRSLGGVAQIQEECRDVRASTYVENFLSDARYGIRTLVKAPVFTLTAIATLALGIGANTAIFQLLNAVRLRSLPVSEPHRLAQIVIPKMNFGVSDYPDNLTYPLFEQIGRRQQPFSAIFAWAYTGLRVRNGADARRVAVLRVTGNFFPALGISPSAGRLFRPENDLRGCPSPGVVLSDSFWRREFGASPTAIGSRVTIQDQALEVIGVAPATFSGPEVGRYFELALPLCSITALNDDTTPFERRDYSWLNVMGRLKPGWTLAQATKSLRAISPGLMHATAPTGYSLGYLEQHYLESRLEAISGATGVSRLREEYDRSLWLLLGLTGLVLLIACANLSNLMLARARARERGVRRAIGARRGTRQAHAPDTHRGFTARRGRRVAGAHSRFGAQPYHPAFPRNRREPVDARSHTGLAHPGLHGRADLPHVRPLKPGAGAACGTRPGGRHNESRRARPDCGSEPFRVSASARGCPGFDIPDPGRGRFPLRGKFSAARHPQPRISSGRPPASPV